MRVHPNHQFKKRIFINHPAIEVTSHDFGWNSYGSIADSDKNSIKKKRIGTSIIYPLWNDVNYNWLNWLLRIGTRNSSTSPLQETHQHFLFCHWEFHHRDETHPIIPYLFGEKPSRKTPQWLSTQDWITVYALLVPPNPKCGEFPRVVQWADLLGRLMGQRDWDFSSENSWWR